MAYKTEYAGLKFERKSHIGYITFDNPRNLNALSYATFASLNQLFDELQKDRDVWGLILTGAGKSFIAGADISDMPSFDYFGYEACRDDRVYIHDTYNKIADFERPTIAAINGYALGGGAELALCCDIRLASDTAKIGFPEGKLGGMPGYSGPSRAARILGPAQAKEMIFTGKNYSGKEACAKGFVSQVVAPEELLPTAEAMMTKIITNAPIAMKFSKLMINHCTEMSLRSSLEYERMIASMLSQTGDYAEGFAAFAQKRKPEFNNK